MDQLKFLKNSIKSGHLSHAYLFFGGAEEERKKAATDFAQELTGYEGKWSSNPDLLLIDLKEGESKISIDQIRSIKKFLSFRPYSGRYKVAVVNDFENMKEEAVNSILKILEEPPEKSVLILLCENPRILLPTVLSRVEKIDFGESAVIDDQDVDKLGKALYILKEITKNNTAFRLEQAEKVFREDEKLEILKHWLLIFNDMVYLAGGCADIVKNKELAPEMKEILESREYSLGDLRSIISEIIHWSFISRTTNTNKRLILENLILIF